MQANLVHFNNFTRGAFDFLEQAQEIPVARARNHRVWSEQLHADHLRSASSGPQPQTDETSAKGTHNKAKRSLVKMTGNYQAQCKVGAKILQVTQ